MAGEGPQPHPHACLTQRAMTTAPTDLQKPVAVAAEHVSVCAANIVRLHAVAPHSEAISTQRPHSTVRQHLASTDSARVGSTARDNATLSKCSTNARCIATHAAAGTRAVARPSATNAAGRQPLWPHRTHERVRRDSAGHSAAGQAPPPPHTLHDMLQLHHAASDAEHSTRAREGAAQRNANTHHVAGTGIKLAPAAARRSHHREPTGGVYDILGGQPP